MPNATWTTEHRLGAASHRSGSLLVSPLRDSTAAPAFRADRTRLSIVERRPRSGARAFDPVRRPLSYAGPPDARLIAFEPPAPRPHSAKWSLCSGRDTTLTRELITFDSTPAVGREFARSIACRYPPMARRGQLSGAKSTKHRERPDYRRTMATAYRLGSAEPRSSSRHVAVPPTGRPRPRTAPAATRNRGAAGYGELFERAVARRPRQAPDEKLSTLEKEALVADVRALRW